ncbi:hypothetical protein LXA20_17635, partial [Erwinia amylovora]|nr:hypothetical protein [Erwinia amylovora]
TVHQLDMLDNGNGKPVIDAQLLGPCAARARREQRLVSQQPLEAADIPYLNDRKLLRMSVVREVHSMV